MIQRIQTVYLALVAIFSILGLCIDIASYSIGAEHIATMTNFALRGTDVSEGFNSFAPATLAFLLAGVISLSLISIMLFRFRMRQLRLTLFSTLLLLGYMALYALLGWKFLLQLQTVNPDATFNLLLGGILPVLSIILNFLAIHAIRKDEALVRSLDRLR